MTLTPYVSTTGTKHIGGTATTSTPTTTTTTTLDVAATTSSTYTNRDGSTSTVTLFGGDFYSTSTPTTTGTITVTKTVTTDSATHTTTEKVSTSRVPTIGPNASSSFIQNSAATTSSAVKTYTSTTPISTTTLSLSTTPTDTSVTGVMENLTTVSPSNHNISTTTFNATKSSASSVTSGSTVTQTIIYTGTYNQTTNSDSNSVSSVITSQDASGVTNGSSKSITTTGSASDLPTTPLSTSTTGNPPTPLLISTSNNYINGTTLVTTPDGSTALYIAQLQNALDAATNALADAQATPAWLSWANAAFATGGAVTGIALALLGVWAQRHFFGKATAPSFTIQPTHNANSIRRIMESINLNDLTIELTAAHGRSQTYANGGLTGIPDQVDYILNMVRATHPSYDFHYNRENGRLLVYNQLRTTFIDNIYEIITTAPVPSGLRANPAPFNDGNAVRLAIDALMNPGSNVYPPPPPIDPLLGPMPVVAPPTSAGGAPIISTAGGGVAPQVIGAGTQTTVELRRLEATPTNRLYDICIDIESEHAMPFENPDKLDALLSIFVDIATMLRLSNLSNDDRQNILNVINPMLNLEYLSIMAYSISTQGTGKTLPFIPLTTVNNQANHAWINLNDWKKSPYYANPSFFDTSKPILMAQASGGQPRSVNLSGDDTQYNAGPESTTDIVQVSTRSTDARTYNINTGGGDDVIILDASLYGNTNTSINLVGGAGSNTYIIGVKKGTQDNSLGKIRILDFDMSKDKVIFLSSPDNFLQPNIHYTYHGEMYKPVTASYNSKGLLELRSEIPNFMQSIFGSGNGLRDTLEGTGIPMLELWTQPPAIHVGDAIDDAIAWVDSVIIKKYNLLIPPGVLNTISYGGDIQDNGATSRAYLLPTIDTQTTYSQFENDHDKDCFKLMLQAAHSYDFHISATNLPQVMGKNYLSKTQLYVTKSNDDGTESSVNSTVVSNGNGMNGNHDFEIRFLAPSDGNYNLYAYSDNHTPVGIYHIDYRQEGTPPSFKLYDGYPTEWGIPNVRQAHGHFTSSTDFQVFTTDVHSGQYIEIDDLGKTSDVSIFDNNGFKITPWSSLSGPATAGIYKFLANTSGQYTFVLNNKPTQHVQDFDVWFTAGLDIEDTVDTRAYLDQDVKISNTLFSPKNLLGPGTGDHDWFRVQLESGKTYMFDMRRDISKVASNSLDAYLNLRNAKGDVVGQDSHGRYGYADDTGAMPNVNATKLDAKLVYQVSVTGTYYIDACAWNNRSMGDYSLEYKVIA